MCEDNWLAEKQPKWHPCCRNQYTKVTSCIKCEEKCHTEEKATLQPEIDPAPEKSRIATRSLDTVFNLITMCIICGKSRFRGKFPDSSCADRQVIEKMVSQAQLTGKHDIV